ncbi:MAG: cation transporter [Chloroflexi bacterium]|nr:cation transporter [Chloroflexota bacterium]
MRRNVSDGLNEARSLNRSALAVALVIALAIVGVEVAGGIFTNSLALLADAGHMVSDVLAVSIALFAIWLASRPASAQQTFGFHRAEVLAAAANGVMLLLVAAIVFWQAALRFSDPPDVSSAPMLGIGFVGLIANVASAVILRRRQSESLNVRGVFYHVLGDLAGSVGVIVAGVIMLTTGWFLADPLVSVAIGLLIVLGAVRLLRESLTVLLETVPSHIESAKVERALTETEGVVGLHDLHIWTVTSGLVALSCHCELTGERDSDQVLAELCDMLHERFAIHHVTIQPEVVRLHGGTGDHSLPRCTSEIGHQHRPAELASTER